MPNTGPSDGSRRQSTFFTPCLASAWASPTETVLFPSPAGVGVSAVTTTSFAFGGRVDSSSATLALFRP